MTYPKTCAICGVEFETEMKRKKYCSRDCYEENNRRNAEYQQRMRQAIKNQRTESSDKFPCLLCELKKNTERHKFCISCRELIRNGYIVDTAIQEHKLIA